MDIPLWIWITFNLFILGLLALDLGVFHRKAHAVSLREAGIWSAVWVGLAAAFNVFLWQWQGSDAALQFLTGYLIEKSLSVDNIFVFVLIFTYFAVPEKYQHRVLFWGIFGALIMRGIFIALGAYVLQQFHWVIYVFGAILVITGIRMALRVQGHDPGANPLVRLVRRLMPVSNSYHGDRFLVREGGRWIATPLLLVLVVVEFSDLVFAIDSIPAIFAITSEPFLVYTANVFAILGLRSMYFLLAGVVHRFVYLKQGLAAVLVFVGAKMLLTDVYKVPVAWSLVVIVALIGGSIVVSLLRRPPATDSASSLPTPHPLGPGRSS